KVRETATNLKTTFYQWLFHQIGHLERRIAENRLVVFRAGGGRGQRGGGGRKTRAELRCDGEKIDEADLSVAVGVAVGVDGGGLAEVGGGGEEVGEGDLAVAVDVAGEDEKADDKAF